MSLIKLRKRAAKLGVSIATQRDDRGWGYWLVDPITLNGIWEDDNFFTNHGSLALALDSLADETQ